MHSRAPASRSDSGFSLIEVLVAGAILVAAIVPTMAAFYVGHSDVAYGGKNSRAVALAEQRIEEIKAAAAQLSGPAFQTNFPADGTVTSGLYTMTWTSTTVGFGASAGDLRRVAVTVTWPQLGRPGRYELVAFVSNPY